DPLPVPDARVRSGLGQWAIGRCDGDREGAVLTEVAVDRGGGGTSLGDGPDDEGLSSAHVTGAEDALDGGPVVGVAYDVAPSVQFHSELFEHALLLRPDESHGQGDQFGGDPTFGPLHGCEAAVGAFDVDE